ncbi:hypothetical protein BG015_002859 [Linnemannia schmuckeri]|uniref:Uncharacterized protein n=1 Tax=Linnemannia schmuckeri TaxID=64567 RepID=A0A9P5VFL1_9FUNG|nr:hypothetical protein BG015_002859 [Linnemannia schmuckeri]
MTASHPFHPRPPLHHQGSGSPAGHAQHHNHYHVHHNHHPYNNSHNQHHPHHNNTETSYNQQHHQYHNQHTQTHSNNNINGEDGDHFHNHVHTVHEYDRPTEESPQPSALWLLNHPSVNRELQRLALRLVERQRKTDDPGVSPCLFVVLPKTSLGLFSASAGVSASMSAGASSLPYPSPSPSPRATTAAGEGRANNNRRTEDEREEEEEDDYWLYFLCDFMMPESTSPMLHVCSPPLPLTPPLPSHPQPHLSSSNIQREYPKYADHHPSYFTPTGTRTTPTRTYPGGYQLRDLNEFVGIHALPMLSLLYLVDQANTHEGQPEWTDRIRGGIRFLAERCKSDLMDIFEEDTQLSPSPEMDSEGRRSGFRDGGRNGEESRGQNEDEDEDSEDEDDEEEIGEEDQWDEEAESELMRLREDDFRDPWRVAGKTSTSGSSNSSSSSVDGINFDNLDLNQHSHNATTKPEQEQDLSGSAGGSSSGAMILGADVLCQVNHPFIEGGILWLCEAHNEMLCKGMAAEKLRQFIKSKQGHCIPMEKSAEIQFQNREDVRVFYRMLDEYKCVIKLKIGLDWPGGATEEDLWELCWAMHSTTVRDLTVDCGGGGVSFRPMLGMMCRLGFMALTVENYNGAFLSPDAPLVTQSIASLRSSRRDSTSNHSNGSDQLRVDVRMSPSIDPHFSLLNFRASPTITLLPDNIQLKKLTFRHWARVPDRRAIVNLVKVLPNLTELETMTDSIERLCRAIQDELQVQAHTGSESRSNSHHYYHPLSHLNLLEVGPYGSKAEFRFSKPSEPEGDIRILETHWKTNQPPRGQGLLQQAIGLETLEFTQCVGLWEMGPELQQIVGCNYSTLRRVEIVCTTERMADVWVFLRGEFMQPTALGSPGGSSAGSSTTGSSSLSLADSGFHVRRVSGGSDNSSSHHQHRRYLRHRNPVHLLIYDHAGHVLESPNAEQYDQTTLSLDQYDHSFRPQLELHSQIASRLRISPLLTDLAQLNLLSQDVGVIALRASKAGLAFCLRELVVSLTRTTFEDVGFLEAVWILMGEMYGLHSLTIQIHSDNNDQGRNRNNRKGQGRQDDMPRRLLEAFRRLGRIEAGPYWSERFERWMQELLVQEMLPIRTGVAFPPGLPVQGGFVFGANESLMWTDGGDGGGKESGGAGVVYSLTYYRP